MFPNNGEGRLRTDKLKPNPINGDPNSYYGIPKGRTIKRGPGDTPGLSPESVHCGQGYFLGSAEEEQNILRAR